MSFEQLGWEKKSTLKRRKPLRRCTPLSPMSKKRQKDNRTYLKLRKEYLEKHPNCQRCGYEASQIHHKRGRGKHLCNVDYFAAICGFCHAWIHDHPDLARKSFWILDK